MAARESPYLTRPGDLGRSRTTPFHEEAALRCRRETFGPTELPVLACRDLAVFKAFFDRSKDWVDLEHMADGGALDVSAGVGVLVEYLGTEDHRVARILQLGSQQRQAR